jgi:hypothetical protein
MQGGEGKEAVVVDPVDAATGAVFFAQEARIKQLINIKQVIVLI